MLSLEKFLLKYHINKDAFESTDIDWNDIVSIYKDFKYNYKDSYSDCLKRFINEYLSDLETIGIHSLRSRVKDPEHLAEKIIRKTNNDYKKYRDISIVNYRTKLTDLAGVRCFLLFKDEWRKFHEYITTKIPNKKEWYLTEDGKSVGPQEGVFHAESPKVHIRLGDDNIYDGVIRDEDIKDDRDYRSIHYIIYYKGIYIELQVRTFFEEGWGEIDHRLKYPYFEDDEEICKVSRLLSRVSGTADELGTYFEAVYRKKYEQGKSADAKGKMTKKDNDSMTSGNSEEIGEIQDEMSAEDIVKITISEG